MILRGVLGLILLLAPAVSAQELRVRGTNDLANRNQRQDDLYTFSLLVGLDRQTVSFTLFERGFTDREAGLRFDETYFVVGKRLSAWGAWRPYAEVGLVHVGKGLIGERGQNLFHQLIGDAEVDLQPLDESHLYPTLRLEVERPLETWHRTGLDSIFEAYTAPGFQSQAAAMLRFHAEPHRHVGFRILGGARFADTSFDPLRPYIVNAAAAGEAALVLWRVLDIAWLYNPYGTEREYFGIGLNFELGGGPKRAADE